MKIRSQIAMILLLPIILGSCQGIPLLEMRKSTPIYINDSAKPIDAIFDCFTTELDEFRGDGRMLVLTYPDRSKAEFSIGAMQTGKFKHYYLIRLTRCPTGTRTEIQRSPSNYFPLSQEELVAITERCIQTH